MSTSDLFLFPPVIDRSCARCRRDDATLDRFGFCPECVMRETETCEEWLARTRPLVRRIGAPK